MPRLSVAAADLLIDTINRAAYRRHPDATSHEALPMLPRWLLDMIPRQHPIHRLSPDPTLEIEAIVYLWQLSHQYPWVPDHADLHWIHVPLIPSHDPDEWLLPATLPPEHWDAYIELASNPQMPPRLAYERVAANSSPPPSTP